MKIIIADDHAIVLRGLQQIIATRPAWQVAAEASDAETLIDALRTDRFDVLIVDVSLGDRSAIELLRQIRAEHPSLPVVMLSMHPEEQYAVPALKAGANGYVQKDAAAEEILNAIATVASGAKYITPRLAGLLAEEVLHGGDKPHERLSPREFSVLRLIALGRSPTDIAETLNISIKTVSTYRTRVLEKTGFRNNAEIIAYAIRNALV
jgi:two-component system invasion response regulator UvrY